MKICARCKTSKPTDEFPRDPQRPGKFYSYCKPCKAEYMRLNRTPARDFRDNLRRACKRVGITESDYYATLEQQGGVCAICGLVRTSHANSDRMALDHDHSTGKFRALLCGECNRGLGSFGDSADRLLAAANYLIQHKEIQNGTRDYKH